MTRLRALAVCLLCALGLPLAVLAAGPRRPVVVLDERVRVAVDVVETPAQRTQGLSGRPGLAPDEGMLFLFEAPRIQSFWMKDMRFEIDIVWIRDGRIVGITPNLPLPKSPRALPQYASPVPCDVVLEVRAGAAHHWGLLVGDRVVIER
ncbi:MAG TPA: DUF192 domain-containing protein [Myxococcota bacterium]|jgi:hypothetical protein